MMNSFVIQLVRQGGAKGRVRDREEPGGGLETKIRRVGGWTV